MRVALPPLASASRSRPRSASRVRAVAMTWAPSAVSAAKVARPMPREAPVTRTIRSFIDLMVEAIPGNGERAVFGQRRKQGIGQRQPVAIELALVHHRPQRGRHHDAKLGTFDRIGLHRPRLHVPIRKTAAEILAE